MAQEKPKKPVQPKQKKLNISPRTTWKNILRDVEKKEVPVHVLKRLSVYLKDGTVVTVEVKKLLSEGADPDQLEQDVNQRLEELDMYIENVDFFVDLELVEQTVQPETDKLLSKL